MKTSNIILTAFLGLILLSITVSFIYITNKLPEMLNTFNEYAESAEGLSEQIELEDFNSIKAEGKVNLHLEKAESNSISLSKGQRYRVNNETLYISGGSGLVKLSFKELTSVYMEGSSSLLIENYNTDNLSLSLSDATRMKAKNMRLSTVIVRSEDASKLEFENSKIDSANFVISDASNVYLINTKCEKMDFEQNDAAEIKFRGKSK